MHFRMDMRKVFAENVRRLRKERGLSQEGLAHEAGIDRTYVSSLERRIYSASIDVVADIARVLGVPPAELLTPSRKRRG